MASEKWVASWWATMAGSEIYTSGPYDSKEDAVGKFPTDYALDAGQDFLVGRSVPYQVMDCPMDTSWILETIGQQAFDAVGEPAEAWPPDVSKEAGQELEAEVGRVVNAWLTKHCLHPTFFSIVDETKHVVPVAVEVL